MAHESDSGLLWAPTPSAVAESSTFRLLNVINTKYSPDPPLRSYEDLYRWSVDQKTLGYFWSSVWDEVGVIGQKGDHVVGRSIHGLCDDAPAINPPWFEDARINWAENMLKCAMDEEGKDRVALAQIGACLYFHRWCTLWSLSEQ